MAKMYGKGKTAIESEEQQKRRWQIELEFVQCLSNPNYLNFLAQRGYFKDPSFINYLKYLQYWKEPDYAKYLMYPMCLYFLDLLQYEHFRREIVNNQCCSHEDLAQKGHFYGVYLLCSQSLEQRYHGKCYVGFTVNPKRRIRQHNRGCDFGGARKTSKKGPWQMVMIVHGFPNNIAALQFEWAWQQPTLSTRLKIFPELKRKQSKESHFEYNFRILNRMLNVGPWHRLPLTVRWLETDYERSFPIELPQHMSIVSGKVAITASQRKQHLDCPTTTAIWAPECHLCMERIEQPERSRLGCLNASCRLTCHMLCLANYLLGDQPGQYIPIGGECPLCETHLIWATLLQRKRLGLGGGEALDQEDSADELSDVPDVDSDVELSD